MTNPLSSLSYTNKDFQSVYVELLDLVKELTHKWDPSISNESDPGVILLKLNAIIADKNNYNIDKNILEAFPETVTQEINARNAYKQLAYNMPWYKSATTDVMLRWVGDELGEGVVATIPKYTMITDEDSSVVYTLLSEVSFNKDKLVTSVKAAQGIIVTHTINSSDIIDIVNLDYKNRLYLNDYTVAENGVFIVNADENENNLWTQVDNLAVKSLGNKYYEFGVDNRNSICYIEFPEDIDSLIKSGLKVKYLISEGAQGNISAKVLDRFYEDVTITVGQEDVTLSSDNVQLYNSSASVGGSDPQTIEEAYRNYKKIAGTFNTLVTLRDYVNAVYNSELVSNGLVCDRLNDVQSSYSVVTEDEVSELQVYQALSSNDVVSYAKLRLTGMELYKKNTYFAYDKSSCAMTLLDETQFNSLQETARTGADAFVYYPFADAIDKDLTSFDLRMYLLHTPGVINNIDAYESTFDMEPSKGAVSANVEGYILDQQCIQHDFKDIIANIPCMFKNSYPIVVKIVPQYKLTTVQQDEVKKNIVNALWEVTNSRSIDFGEEPDYDKIYDTISNSDERIKVVILDDFAYTTFATYWDGKQFKDIPISSDSSSNLVINCKYKDLESYADTARKLIPNTRLYNAYFIITDDTDDAKCGDVYRYNTKKKNFELYSALRKEFQQQVLAKSILAGKTPLFNQDTSFQHSIDQEFITIEDTDRISTHQVISPFADSGVNPELTDIDLDGDGKDDVKYILPSLSTDSNLVSAEYTLKDNESLRFLAPSFTTDTSYSNYAKFELVLKNPSDNRKVIVDRSSESPVSGRLYYVSREQYERNVLLAGWDLSNYDVAYNDSANVYKMSLRKGAGIDHGDNTMLNCLGLSTEKELPVQTSLDISGLSAGVQYTLTFYTKDVDGDGECNLSVEVFRFSDNTGASATGNLEDITTTESKNGWKRHTGTFIPRDIKTDLTTSNVTSVSIVFTVTGNNYSVLIDDVSLSSADNENLVSAGTFDYYGTSSTTAWTLVEDGSYYTGMLKQGDYTYELWASGKITVYDQRDIYDIPANTDYQLKAGDYIAFFWREEDADDAPFRYRQYSGIAENEQTSTNKSPIINATFTIHGVSINNAKAVPLINSEGELVCGSESYQTVLGFYGDNDLSGTKEIKIRKMNQVELNYAKNQYYFITNNIKTDLDTGDERYVMPLRLSAINTDTATEKTYTYVLKTDEYFIYTASDMTEFEILGPGTLVGIVQPYDKKTEPKPSQQYVVDCGVVNYVDIINSGITAFADECLYFSSSDKMFVREQQIYNLVEGDKVMLNIDTANTNSDVSHDVDFTLIDDYGVEHKYPKPFFCSWMDTVVRNFNVSYVSSTGGTVSLPQLMVYDNDSMWMGRAYLNLDCSYDNPQTITPITDDNKSCQFLIVGKDETNSNIVYPQTIDNTIDTETFYIESSIQLNKVGGSDIDISYLDGYGDRRTTELYLYHKSEAFYKDPFQIRDDGKIVGTYNKFENVGGSYIARADVTLDTNGSYILSIQNTSELATLQVLYNDRTPLDSLNGGTSLLSNGTYYIKLKNSVSAPITSITFKCNVTNVDDLSEGECFIIDKLFKYTDNELFEEKYGYSSDDMISLVQALDFENKFKYNYVVDEALQIKDPLVAKTFFDTNHVFNPYTIGKAETRMSDATDASINIINNR